MAKANKKWWMLVVPESGNTPTYTAAETTSSMPESFTTPSHAGT